MTPDTSEARVKSEALSKITQISMKINKTNKKI